MTVLYKLSKEQLSKQYHYDFGLRALKSVLVMAGELKRSSQDLAEDVVLMRALRDMNLPKFVFEDVPLFSGLISDLFPGLACPRVRYPDFNDAVEEVPYDTTTTTTAPSLKMHYLVRIRYCKQPNYDFCILQGSVPTVLP